MTIKLKHIVNLPQFNGLVPLTDKNIGMDNEVVGCGILDYEFEETARNRYKHIHFYPDIIVLTSLLYAKDNEYLLMDAIKNLISKKCAALVIKNIYQLHIPNNIIKYANNNNFPIFILKGQDILFEHFIVNVHDIVKNSNSILYQGKKLEEIMNHEDDTTTRLNKIQELCPLLESDYLCIYFRFKDNAPDNDVYNSITTLTNKLNPLDTDSILYYKKGFVFIHSAPLFNHLEIDKVIEKYLDAFNELSNSFYISISNIFHDLSLFNKAINECFYTSIITNEDDLYKKYNDIGTFKLIVPCNNCYEFTKYSNEYIEKIQEYDLEFRTNSLETLTNYILSHGNIDVCAMKSGVHANTIRYRLNNLNSLLNVNIFDKDDYEQISFAIKINYFQEKLLEFENMYNIKLRKHCMLN